MLMLYSNSSKTGSGEKTSSKKKNTVYNEVVYVEELFHRNINNWLWDV